MLADKAQKVCISDDIGSLWVKGWPKVVKDSEQPEADLAASPLGNLKIGLSVWLFNMEPNVGLVYDVKVRASAKVPDGCSGLPAARPRKT